MVSDQVLVNVAQAVYLFRGSKSVLYQLQKRVCCKFAVQQVGWNEFKVLLNGTESGVKKGRALLEEQLENYFKIERRNRAKSKGKFEYFDKLPLEIKQMIM
jgi:hypothetical protein